MAPLRRDQLVHPNLMGRRPDGMLPDCRLLGLRERIDATVGHDLQVCWAVEDDHRVEQHQVVEALGPLSHDRHR